MKVKEMARGPGMGPLVHWPCALEQSLPLACTGGDLSEVSLRPQGQGWAVITSGKARSGTSQTARVSYKIYQTQACVLPIPPTPFPPSNLHSSRARALLTLNLLGSGVPSFPTH